MFDCFFVGIVGEDWILNEGYVFFLYCDGLVFVLLDIIYYIIKMEWLIW